MIISRKAWFVRLYFLMSWLNAKAFGKDDHIEDPKDICPMMRMILLWGPIGIMFLLLKLAILVFVIVGVGLLIFGFGSLAASMPLTELLSNLFLFVMMILAVVAVVVVLALLCYGCFRLNSAIRESAFAAWWNKRFPKRTRPERVILQRPAKTKKPKPPGSVQLFFSWVDGQLHGWCSPLTLVDDDN
jgi:hypothetical protein